MTNQTTINRTIQNLRNEFSQGHVYVSFNGQKEYDDFLVMAGKEGYSFKDYRNGIDHEPSEFVGKPWDIISVLDDKKLAFCGAVSHMAFGSNAKNVHRIDYNKYISGDSDYLI